MIKSTLSQFVDRVSQNKHIAPDDVKVLLRSVLEDGLISREQAETLLALDRTFDAHESWSDALVTLVVDYVVWGARPTGSVTAEDARWLAAALGWTGRPRPGCGSPTRSSRKRRPRTRRWSISSCADISWRKALAASAGRSRQRAMLEYASAEPFPGNAVGFARLSRRPCFPNAPWCGNGGAGFSFGLGQFRRGGRCSVL